MKDSIRLEINMEQRMCNDCKKSSTEYYELLSQVRVLYFEDMYEIKKKIFSLFESFNSINKIEEVSNGFDIYFRYHGEMNKVYRMLLKGFLIDEIRSKKLVGKNQLKSVDIYRYYQSITLVNIEKNDKISLKGDEYYIRAINNNSELILLNCVSGAKKMITYSIVKDYIKLIEKRAYNNKQKEKREVDELKLNEIETNNVKPDKIETDEVEIED